MWKVEFESARVEREVTKLMQIGSISTEDRLIITTWIRQVSFEGPKSIRGDKRWADHELQNEWEGYRSSCYSNRGRIIYRVEERVVKILVARITPDHDYGKERKK